MRATLIILSFFFLIGACSQQQPEQELTTESQGITIENGWVRPTSSGMMTAAYFVINNESSDHDTLIGIQSNVTSDTQIHESYEMEGGIMGMREIGVVPIPANSTAELRPGGMHIMIIRPSVDVSVGDSVDFVLQFANHGQLELSLPVQIN